MAIGLSTDGLLDPKFAARFCEPACQTSCPNIIDLLTKLAVGEGIYLQTCATFSGQKHEASLLDMASCTNMQGFWENMLLLLPSNKFRMMSFCVYIYLPGFE
ncbi:hypothetical protein O6H91_22G050200 [Diphasiastrum complanatum]|uniref:Uncharacterized protein n=1 Tax=Diphasiastrum complanatum TaxID=34168 RepID=A0ACC2AFL8_DIPCM|nr:hypothetical protein O6H91_22G050200 [Diphasiastrum complanatum]